MTHQFIMKNGLKGFQPLAGLLGDDTTPFPYSRHVGGRG